MANPKLLEMFGFKSLEEFQKINLDEYEFHPDYPREHIKKKIEQDGGIKGFEAVWKNRMGRLFICVKMRLVFVMQKVKSFIMKASPFRINH